jgi:dimethylargininase
MRPWEFDRALARAPARSVTDGLRAGGGPPPTHAGVAAEHAAYVRALTDAGVAVEVLPALEAYPDSLFVEDPALVFADAAIVLRPGAASRRGEADEIAPALARNFARVLRLERGFADGGDVLTTPRGVFIGRSARTDRDGAEALVALLGEIGLEGIPVATPEGVLHLKSDCAILDGETILITRRLAAPGGFGGFRLIEVAEGEEGAANAIAVNGRVLMSAQYPRTIEIVMREGYRVEALDTREIARVDAGLSCMSLRWRG